MDATPLIKSAKRAPFSDEVARYHSNWTRVSSYFRLMLDSNSENWRFYWAKNPEKGFGQWPLSAISRMAQQGRSLVQYNLTRPTVDAIAALLLQMPVDPEFALVNGDYDPLVEKIKKIMYSDKELCNWKMAEMEMTTQGLVGFACLRIGISDEFDPLGNIALYSELPGSVLPDPFWKTRISKDCKRCWKETWFTIDDIIEEYPEFEDRLKAKKAQLKHEGTRYGANSGINTYNVTEDTWGSLYRVIEEYEMVTVKKNKEFAYSEEMGEVEIPEMDEMDKIGWLNENVPDWHPDLVYTKPTTQKICYVHTICPSLIPDKLLEDGPIEIQIGRLPFMWWAASMAHGEFSSIVDAVKDMQMDINYTSAMIKHKMQVEGGGGSQFVDPSKFKSHTDYLNFCRYRGHPTKNFNVKPGVLDTSTPARPVQQSQFPQELYTHLNTIIDKIWPHTSKVTPSTVGQTEQNNQTSGRLYELLKMQSDRLLYTIVHGRRLFYNDVFEAYFMLAVQLYSNEDLERSFSYNKEKIVLNKRLPIGEGREVVVDQVSRLKKERVKVIISDKQESPTEKMDNVSILSEFYQRVAKNQPLTAAVVNMETVKNIEQFSDESKRLIEDATKLEMELVRSGMELQIATNRAQLMQMQSGVPSQGNEEMALPAQTGEEVPAAGAKQLGAPKETMLTPPPGDIINTLSPSPEGGR